MAKNKEKGFIYTKLETCMKGRIIWIKSMVMVYINILKIRKNTKDIGLMAKNKEMEYIIMQTAIDMKANGKIIKNKEKGCFFINLQKAHMRDNGKMIRLAVMALLLQMSINMKEILRMDKSMEMAYTFFLMVQDMKGNFRMIF
jgi:hypothetical protein